MRPETSSCTPAAAGVTSQLRIVDVAVGRRSHELLWPSARGVMGGLRNTA
ncbi:hypothetical protein LWP59_31215 [Amycolatopsis acidiphila]|nr:hypothetical protein [Amycolatopsis acidiphila]UIJ58542.1 hypothetical protein LWP59_31215 [Amycolatopsis acidiphila]